MHLAPFEGSLVGAAITILLKALPLPEVVLPVPFVDLATIIDHDADALPFVIAILPVVDSLFVLFESEMGGAVEGCEVDLIGEVGFEVVVQLFVCVAVAVGGGED